MIQYKHDINRLQKLKRQYDNKIVEKALRQSVATATSRVRTYVSREVRGVYPLRAKDLNGKVQIRKYRQMATRALVYIGGRLPLSTFKPTTRKARVVATSSRGKRFRTTRQRVSVRVRKDKGRQVVRGGWLAKDAVMRRADQGDNASQPRKQYGPSIPGMVAHDSVMTGATDVARDVLPREFNRRMEVLLEDADKS